MRETERGRDREKERKIEVRSGQVKVFNVHIQSKMLLCTPVTGTGKKRGGSEGGPPALAGTREYEQSDQNR